MMSVYNPNIWTPELFWSYTKYYFISFYRSRPGIKTKRKKTSRSGTNYTFDPIDLEIPNFKPVSFLLCFTFTVNILFSRMLILLKQKFETLLFLSISNQSFIYCTVQTTDWCFVWFAITCPLQPQITWWCYPNLDLYLHQGSISFEKLKFNRNLISIVYGEMAIWGW